MTPEEQVEDLSAIRNGLRTLAGELPVFSSRMITSEIHRLDGQIVNERTLPRSQFAPAEPHQLR